MLVLYKTNVYIRFITIYTQHNDKSGKLSSLHRKTVMESGATCGHKPREKTKGDRERSKKRGAFNFLDGTLGFSDLRY